MSEPTEVFTGNLSGGAIYWDAVLMSKFVASRSSPCYTSVRGPLTFLQMPTVLEGAYERG